LREVGVFKSLRRKLDQSDLDARHAREDKRGVGERWQRWALDNGFRYESEDPSLAGQFLQRFDEGVESYRHVMRGQVRGLDMIVFEHDRVWPTSGKSGVGSDQREAYLVVRLPRHPSQRVLDRGASRLFADFNVHLADNYQPDFLGTGWLAIHRSRSHDPKRLALHADLLAQLVALAPEDVWSDAST
jgi:hypothetical protein